MRNSLIIAALLAAAPGLAQEGKTRSDAALPPAFAAWRGAAEPVTATADAAAPLIAIGKPYQVTLQPAAAVRFAAAPETDNSPPDAHAGLLRLRVAGAEPMRGPRATRPDARRGRGEAARGDRFGSRAAAE